MNCDEELNRWRHIRNEGSRLTHAARRHQRIGDSAAHASTDVGARRAVLLIIREWADRERFVVRQDQRKL